MYRLHPLIPPPRVVGGTGAYDPTIYPSKIIIKFNMTCVINHQKKKLVERKLIEGKHVGEMHKLTVQKHESRVDPSFIHSSAEAFDL